MMKLIYRKIGHAGGRFRYGMNQWPLRVKRLANHMFFRLPGVLYRGPLLEILVWPAEFILLCLDCILIPEWYEIGVNIVKYRLRKLTQSEIAIAEEVFGKAIDWDLVRIDESAHLGPRQHHFAYVSFFTINSYGPLPDYILIHELVHIWQFQQYGSVYIIRALLAQYSKDKYNYGGVVRLMELRNRKGFFADFNFEQQADIVSDYFLLTKGRNLQWCHATPDHMSVFEYFVHQMDQPGMDYR